RLKRSLGVAHPGRPAGKPTYHAVCRTTAYYASQAVGCVLKPCTDGMPKHRDQPCHRVSVRGSHAMSSGVYAVSPASALSSCPAAWAGHHVPAAPHANDLGLRRDRSRPDLSPDLWAAHSGAECK